MRALGKDKRRMALWLFVAAVLGVVVAFSIPRTYKSVVMLAPETTGSSMASSISSLASMVGIYGSNNMTGDASGFSDGALAYKGNKDLTWEKSVSYNIGIDFALLNEEAGDWLRQFIIQKADLLR